MDLAERLVDPQAEDDRLRVRGPWLLAGVGSVVLMTILCVCLPIAWTAFQTKRVRVDTFEVVASYPHDDDAFTQGLLIDRGRMFESTGMLGESTLREVNLETGEVLRNLKLDGGDFAEGLAALNGKLYQLTWKNRRGYVYDQKTFQRIGTWQYRGEGWGLTTDGESLIMSNGSHKLQFIDPETLSPVLDEETGKPKVLEVRDGNRPIFKLNELEFVAGEVWANVWGADSVVRISPKTGAVLGYVDFSSLYPYGRRPDTRDKPREARVLNGIAFDRAKNKLYVTGKWWPQIYEVRVVAAER